MHVLERRPAALALGQRQRADYRVIEVAPRGGEDLILVDIQQSRDHVLGDLRRLLRQRPLPGPHQRIHPERRPAEVKEPHPLTDVRRCCSQTDVRELALRVQDDRRCILILAVVDEVREQGRGVVSEHSAGNEVVMVRDLKVVNPAYVFDLVDSLDGQVEDVLLDSVFQPLGLLAQDARVNRLERGCPTAHRGASPCAGKRPLATVETVRGAAQATNDVLRDRA